MDTVGMFGNYAKTMCLRLAGEVPEIYDTITAVGKDICPFTWIRQAAKLVQPRRCYKTDIHNVEVAVPIQVRLQEA
jgi:hypothetical protein